MQRGNKSTFPDVLPVINEKPGFRATLKDARDISESLKSKRTKIGQSALPAVKERFIYPLPKEIRNRRGTSFGIWLQI